MPSTAPRGTCSSAMAAPRKRTPRASKRPSRPEPVSAATRILYKAATSAPSVWAQNRANPAARVRSPGRHPSARMDRGLRFSARRICRRAPTCLVVCSCAICGPMSRIGRVTARCPGRPSATMAFIIPLPSVRTEEPSFGKARSIRIARPR